MSRRREMTDMQLTNKKQIAPMLLRACWCSMRRTGSAGNLFRVTWKTFFLCKGNALYGIAKNLVHFSTFPHGTYKQPHQI